MSDKADKTIPDNPAGTVTSTHSAGSRKPSADTMTGVGPTQPIFPKTQIPSQEKEKKQVTK